MADDVDERSILALQDCGPKENPGMAAVGNLGLARKPVGKGAQDMIRISDARMDGTAHDAANRHGAPDAERRICRENSPTSASALEGWR